jgi:hypothetical protein
LWAPGERYQLLRKLIKRNHEDCHLPPWFPVHLLSEQVKELYTHGSVDVVTAMTSVQIHHQIHSWKQGLELINLSNVLAPVMVALTANSVFCNGSRAGLSSMRQLLWHAVSEEQVGFYPRYFNDVDDFLDFIIKRRLFIYPDVHGQLQKCNISLSEMSPETWSIQMFAFLIGTMWYFLRLSRFGTCEARYFEVPPFYPRDFYEVYRQLCLLQTCIVENSFSILQEVKRYGFHEPEYYLPAYVSAIEKGRECFFHEVYHRTLLDIIIANNQDMREFWREWMKMVNDSESIERVFIPNMHTIR